MYEPRPAMISAPLGQKVERRELLENAHRIVRAEHGDSAGEFDGVGCLRHRGQHHSGRRDSEVRPMMLADSEDVQPDLVGNGRLFHQMSKVDTGIHRLAGFGVWSELAEMVDAEFECHGVSLYRVVGVMGRCVPPTSQASVVAVW